MLKNCKGLAALLTALILSLLLVIPALAADEVNFLVSPVLPANQRADATGYFDLMVQPGQTQELSIEVTNKASEAIVVEIEAITASTNLNGIVNYTTPGENHASLPHQIADLVTIEAPLVEIPAHTTQTIKVLIQMPDEAYDGYLLGGIHVKKQLSEAELASGQTILNQFSYVIALKLAENEAVQQNDFLLDNIEADLVNGRASIINYIVNPQPVLVKGMDTTVRIFPQGSDTPLMERTMEETDMAPNSVFPFTLVDDAGYGVKAGTYRSLVEIRYNGEVWEFDQEFVIKAEQAAAINNNAVNLATQQTAMDSGLSTWALVVMICAIILFIIILVLLVYVIKRMKENQVK